MAFAAPHAALGEVAAVALPAGSEGVTLLQLRSWLRASLPTSSLPQLLVRTRSLPTTAATGKLQRLGYAAALGVPPLSGTEIATLRFDPAATPAERLTAEAAPTAAPRTAPRPADCDGVVQTILDMARSQAGVDGSIEGVTQTPAPGAAAVAARGRRRRQ